MIAAFPPRPMTKLMTARTTRLLATLTESPKTIREIATALDLRISQIGSVLSTLYARGQLVRVGKRPYFIYSLAPPHHVAPDARARNEYTHEEDIVETTLFVPLRTITIDGVEYDVVNDCRGPVTQGWPSHSSLVGDNHYHPR